MMYRKAGGVALGGDAPAGSGGKAGEGPQGKKGMGVELAAVLSAAWAAGQAVEALEQAPSGSPKAMAAVQYLVQVGPAMRWGIWLSGGTLTEAACGPHKSSTASLHAASRIPTPAMWVERTSWHLTTQRCSCHQSMLLLE